MITLRQGDRGADVIKLQAMLVDKGFIIVNDGNFGGKTTDAVRRFQQANNLIDDGVGSVSTMRCLRGIDISKSLKKSDLIAAASVLNVDLATIYAVTQVECNGYGFLDSGKPAILYERHIMRRRLLAKKLSAIGYSASLVNTKTGGYVGGLGEYVRLDEAIKIDRECALESCSWGAFQVMGFNWDLMGYDSVDHFTGEMAISEGKHLDAFVRFVGSRINSAMLKALQRKDWAAFAKLYNGLNYKLNDYDTKLATAFGWYARFLTGGV